ncbi:NAD-dependent epimerase/dehydratase family protein [Candidatus Lokiarchaeum ossiferum]|uniref:NAD-dependent epimerase/dehydratase family protein n=1 Tax=Candidatus Lokiarchaeum ossiferum TaxID=2951803 RepID=UPI00352E304B
MQVLIIGGSRFSGKQLLLKLHAAGHAITVINRGNQPFIYPSGVIHHKLDRNHVDALQQVLIDKEFDWVFDFIAWKGTESKQLLGMLKGRIKKFIHVSTVDVYDLNHIERYITHPIYENDPVGPINNTEPSYPLGKRMCERDLLKAYHEFGFPVVILRPTYIYGPDNYSFKEAYFFHRILSQLPLYLLSPESLYLDMIHAEDMADLCLLAAQSSSSSGQIYNATTGEFITSLQLARLVSRWCKIPFKYTFFTSNDVLSLNWPGERRLWPYEYPISMTFSNIKAITELGFKPRYRLIDGLRQTFDWFLSLSTEAKQRLWGRYYYSPEWEEKLALYFMDRMVTEKNAGTSFMNCST